MSDILKKGSKQTIIFICPFRTGLIVNSRELLVDRYAPFQKELIEKLSQHNVGTWCGADMDIRSNGMEIDSDTNQGRTVIPRYLVGIFSQDDKLTAWLQKHSIVEAMSQACKGMSCRVVSVDGRFYDYGMGCANVQVEIELEENLSVEAYKKKIEDLGSQLHCLNHICKDFIAWVRDAIPERYLMRDYSAPYDTTDPTLEDFYDLLPKNHGQILWAHRLFTFQKPEGEIDKSLVSEKKGLLVNDLERVSNVSFSSDAVGYIGDGASFVIADGIDHEVVQKMAKMIHIQNVLYVTIEDMTRHLFYLNNEISRLKENRTIRELERQSSFIIRYQSQISFFRAIYDDYDNTLDPQSLKIWSEIETCWDTANRFQDLEYKMSLAERVYDRIMQSLSNMHSKRLGIFVLVFTILSMLSVIVDTVDFTQGEGLSAPNIVRMSVLAMMSLMAVILAAILLRSKRL